MDRRSFLIKAGLAAGAGLATSTLAKPALSQSIRTLRMVTCWPKGYPGLGEGAQRIADRITIASGGRLEVAVYGAGELVPALECFDAVASGSADLYHGAEYYWAHKDEAFNFFGAVPFGLTAAEHSAWIHYGGGQALWDQLSAQFGIKPLLAGNTGEQFAGWFKKEINSVNDLVGLTMRIGGFGAHVLGRLGGSSIMLPASEIIPAMRAGALDAAEWVGPWADYTLGLPTAAKYCYYPGFNEPSAARSLGVNLELWSLLSKEDQSIIAAAANAENEVMQAQFKWNNAKALQQIRQEGKVHFKSMPEEVTRAFYQITQGVIADAASRSELAMRANESMKAAKLVLNDWNDVTNRPFLNMRADYS